MKKQQKKQAAPRKVFGAVGVILCLLIAPILLINIIFIIQSFVNPDEVPHLLGLTPMVVVTDSMTPTISGGDMVIDRKVPAEDVQVGDIISFFDPTRNDQKIVITHRVTEIETRNGELYFWTKGDANNTADGVPVPAGKLVGVYQNTIPYLGSVVLFMRTTPGVILTVVLPILALIAYELLKAKKREKEKAEEARKLKEELENAKQNGNGSAATADCAIT